MDFISWTERDVFVLGMNCRKVFNNSLHGGKFLLPWAYMDPTVNRCMWEPTSWEYLHNGRKRIATIPLVVVLHTGEMEYWDAEDTRRGVPPGIAVKRAHAEALGRPLRFFDPAFIEDNIVEYHNRRNSYFLLASLVEHHVDLKPCEGDVLQELASHSMALGQLCVLLDQHPAEHVRAVVMDLWRRGLVNVPVATELMGPRWLVRRVRHA